MDYKQNFFYEYVNILVDQGCPKYDAIDRYIWDPTIPYDYKSMKCIQDEIKHANKILKEEKRIRDENKREIEYETKCETKNETNIELYENIK